MNFEDFLIGDRLNWWCNAQKGGCNMKNSNITKGVFFTILVLTISGCGVIGEETGEHKDTSTTDTNANVTSGEDQDVGGVDSTTKDNDVYQRSADQLIDSATMIGSVTSFTNDGCIVNQQLSEDGGQTAKIAAEGIENTDTSVTISYRENCVFQIAEINITTGEMTLRNADKANLKKSTNILIFGEVQNTRNLVADKIVITRYE